MNPQVLLHQAALLNREGIAALAFGYSEKAHACFKNVLEIMGYISQSQELQNQSNTHKPLLDGFEAIPIPNLKCDRFFIYDNAFLFRSNQQSYSQLDITLLSAASIFNMALTYNQRALVGHHSQEMLWIAARLYDQCFQIIRSLPAGNQDTIVFQMIVLNNRSHIAYELGDFEAAEQTLGEVCRLSRRLARETQLSPSPPSSILREDVFDEIALNVVATSAPTTAPCA